MKLQVLLLSLLVFIVAVSSEEATPVAANDTDTSATNIKAETLTTLTDASANNDTGTSTTTEEAPVQTGPFIDLLGPSLLSLEMVDETHAQLASHYTNDALRGKSVVGLYFSADWCGPCRQFTPELVSFYNKMNARRGNVNKFEIVWISRCRDFDSFGQYFTHMNWLAMQPEDAMGQRGQMLSDKYKVKGIPSLVLLDDLGNVITTDGRNKIPADKAGIGFPWRNPIARVYMTILPKSLRLMLKSQIKGLTGKIVGKIKGAVGLKPASA
jgi:thiol-disulfide isomerase/thioredoxin